MATLSRITDNKVKRIFLDVSSRVITMGEKDSKNQWVHFVHLVIAYHVSSVNIYHLDRGREAQSLFQTIKKPFLAGPTTFLCAYQK